MESTSEYVSMVINAFIGKLPDENPAIRSKAAEFLGQSGEETAIPALISRLSIENDSRVRFSLIQALGNIGSSIVIPDLVGYLNDADATIRQVTAEAIGKIGNEKAIDYLRQSLQDSDASVRSTTARALGQIGSGETIPDLITLLSDVDEEVRLQAIEALGEIGSRLALT